MARQVVLWIVAGLVHLALGYNLNMKEPHVIVQAPDISSSDSKESLFGWSVENFKVGGSPQMFVGAPRAWSGRPLNETGKVYKCTHRRSANNVCVNIPTNKARDVRDEIYGWYGASLAAGKDKIYTCAPFRGNTKWWEGRNGLQLSKSRVLGNCLKFEDSGSGQFSRATEFRHSYPFNGNNFNQHWAQRGSYGIAAVVDEDDDIVVGAPLATAFQDWSGTRGSSRFEFGQDYHSGAIVKYKQSKQFWPKVEESQFVILNTEGKGYTTEMLNHYKLAGMAIDKAKMYDESTSRPQSAAYSYVIGAPKADNNLGKVYVCSKCFDDAIRGRSNFYFPEGNFEVKPSPENRQIGEKFGAALTACDVNGDGHDDVIVGAPFYSDNQHDSFNSGRVHVFVKAAIGVKKGNPATLMPNSLPRGSRFGTALACLGDTNGDTYQEVVVGAPYYNYDKYGTSGRTSGVIFIYQGYQSGLRKDYSQKITAAEVGPQLKGFGISFSKRGSVSCSDTSNLRVPDCSQCPTYPGGCNGDCEKKCLGGDCFGAKTKTCVPKSDKFDTQTGLSIGAHMSNHAVYMQFRKVPRFKDVSKIDHPNSIPPETTKIKVSFKPLISTHPYDLADSTATLDVPLDLEVHVEIDAIQERISGRNTQSAQLSMRAGTTAAAEKIFTFNVDTKKLGRDDQGNQIKADPIPVDFKVKWTLPSCNTPICPMFDPEEAKGAGGKVKEVRHTRRFIIVKSGCENDVCKCDIKLSLSSIKTSMVAGENTKEKVVNILLENKDKEPAFGTHVNITVEDPDNPAKSMEVIKAGDYYLTQTDNKKTYKLEVPFIRGQDSENIPVTIRTLDISAGIKKLKLTVDAIPECPKNRKQSVDKTIEVKHQWNVLAKPLYPNSVNFDKFNWDWRNEDKERKITQTFQIKNEGPSPSGKAEFYVFIPKSSTLLSGHKVELDAGSSAKCNPHSTTVPSDIQIRSCGLSGDCVSFKCSIPGIKGGEYFNLEVSVMFDLDAAKKQEKPSFNVITSVQTVDHKNPRTTTFWKTTLEYSGQSIIQQIFNNMYVVAGVVVGLIVLIIISIILWKCNVFSNVRIYKDKVEERRGMSVELEKT